MRQVRSPYVAEVLDADLTCEPPYIVTQYVRGRTLDQLVNESGPLNGPALARLARGSSAALCAVHAAGVVHRDLKPGNIMLSEGEPVVIDFGIAHAADSSKITQTGMFMGTPGYLAPEVIEGKGATQASDVHSWGSTIAFAATGRPPFGTGTFEVIFYRIMNGSPDLEGCPAALVVLLTEALARDPLRRPSAEQLAARLGVLAPADLRPGRAAAQGSAAGGQGGKQGGAPSGDAPAGELPRPGASPVRPGASADLPAAGVSGVAPAGLAAAAAPPRRPRRPPPQWPARPAPGATRCPRTPRPSTRSRCPQAAPCRPPWPTPPAPPGWRPGEGGENAATQRGADDEATDEGAVEHAPSDEITRRQLVRRRHGDSGPRPESTAAAVLGERRSRPRPARRVRGVRPGVRRCGQGGGLRRLVPGPLVPPR